MLNALRKKGIGCFFFLILVLVLMAESSSYGAFGDLI